MFYDASCHSTALFFPFKLHIDSPISFAALAVSTLGSLFFFLFAWLWVDYHYCLLFLCHHRIRDDHHYFWGWNYCWLHYCLLHSNSATNYSKEIALNCCLSAVRAHLTYSLRSAKGSQSKLHSSLFVAYYLREWPSYLLTNNHFLCASLGSSCLCDSLEFKLPYY